MQTYVGDIQQFYTKSGLVRYMVMVNHTGLGLVHQVKDPDPNLVYAKAQAKAQQWDERWSKKVAAEQKRNARAAKAADIEAKKRFAEQRTTDVQAAWESLGRVLALSLAVDNAVNWNMLKDRTPFRVPAPAAPDKSQLPPETNPAHCDYRDAPRFFDQILDLFSPQRKAKRQAELQEAFEEDHAKWSAEVAKLTARDAKAMATHRESVAAWEQEKGEYLERQKACNAAVDEHRRRYEEGDPDGISDYFDLVLTNSEYADWYPNNWELEYNAETKLLIIEYQLPSPDAIPRLRQVKYVQSRDALTEASYSDAQLRQAYDNLIYQIGLRTIHEVLQADGVGALAMVAFNGRVQSVDPATGHEVNACIMSLQINREEFMAINLGAVDPKACFRKLKGVGSSKLHSLTPVAPLIQILADDGRFVASYEVTSTLDEGENLAAMDWEDFEHLVREVFEREFSGDGGTVKVTRASRDGGIDAVAFDPDPIRGGKIVIQAKRYTKTVGVSAVRDLYGAVMNEGAIKGILVSTATYGPDAYAFVRDKPLTLLDGNNLLHLLQKHGHKVRIDLVEARALRDT
jgi:restriction system protein